MIIEPVLEVNPEAVVVVKSAVPVGCIRGLVERYPEGRFLFNPEFLREGRALCDNLHSSRIIVGVPGESAFAGELEGVAHGFARLLSEGAGEPVGSIPTLVMRATEAEALKLLANTCLALRVSYFNELDTYVSVRGHDGRQPSI